MKTFKNTQVEAINEAINNVKQEPFVVSISCNHYGDYDVKLYVSKFEGREMLCVRTIAVGGQECDFYSSTTYPFNDSGLDRAFEDLTAVIIL